MKFRLIRPFNIQVTPTKVKTYPIGEYNVPSELPEEYAVRAKKQHIGFFVVGKVAPENKVGKVSESKSNVARKKVRRRSTGAESDGDSVQEDS
jgi:hypothetical protein